MMTNEEYIQKHKLDDVRSLALKKAEEGVDIKWCLQQIEGWQKSRDKLPRWAETEGVWFPPVISMEQCSSEPTASYKARIIERILPAPSDRSMFMDLTGGYGIDFSFMAPLFARSIYVERSQELCDIAIHNFELLHLDGAKVVCRASEEFLQANDTSSSLIFLDPARRDGAGRKTVAISDCTPDVSQLQETLFDRSRFILLKLSPMLDINLALTVLKHVSEVHAVSLKGECKELLFLMDREYHGMPTYFASNLESGDEDFSCTHEHRISASRVLSTGIGEYLYEPNASILKAGIQDVLCERYSMGKLHPNSNLFTSSVPCPHFPGRGFRVESCCGFGKKELRQMLSDISRANISIRNFPSTVVELRRKLKLAEGGETYLFASTMADGKHVLIRCVK